MSEILWYTALVLTILIICIKLLFSHRLFRDFQRDRQNFLVLGASILFFFLAVSRVLMLYFDFFLTEFNPEKYQDYILYWKLANLFTWIGYLALIMIMEKSIFKGKTHHLISIIYIIFIIISLAIPDFTTAQNIAAIPTAAGIVLIPFSYLYLARHEQIRKQALMIFLGYIVFSIGYLLLAEFIMEGLISITNMESIQMRYIIHIGSIGLRLAGVLLLSYGYLYF
ncbi:MAG: hypothetical protein EU544_03645 [Promethearchaeota archaeon]|nr:MAG: hypothetical protein EU544_03645 [Candidatus Lokiarchaeota archaeon]